MEIPIHKLWALDLDVSGDFRITSKKFFKSSILKTPLDAFWCFQNYRFTRRTQILHFPKNPFSKKTIILYYSSLGGLWRRVCHDAASWFLTRYLNRRGKCMFLQLPFRHFLFNVMSRANCVAYRFGCILWTRNSNFHSVKLPKWGKRKDTSYFPPFDNVG